MKRILLLLTIVLQVGGTYAQRTIMIRNLWAEPEVHVVFGNYMVSYTIKDINKALAILFDIGDSSYGRSSGLDTANTYSYALSDIRYPVYHLKMEEVLQNGVGVFLLLSGHSKIAPKKHPKRALRSIEADIGTVEPGEKQVTVKFYNPKNGQMIFSGKMDVDMYGKDLGID